MYIQSYKNKQKYILSIARASHVTLLYIHTHVIIELKSHINKLSHCGTDISYTFIYWRL